MTRAQNSTTVIAMPDGSFEAPVYGASPFYGYQPANSEWKWSGLGGVQRNGSGLGAVGAPSGSQTAFLQGSGAAGNQGAFWQKVTLPAGSYKVTFKAAQRATGAAVPIQIKMDNTAIGAPINPTSTAFVNYDSVPFEVGTSGTYRLGFSTDSGSGVSMSLIDVIAVESVQPVVSGGFENPVISSYAYNPANSGWDWGGMAGIQRNGSLGANAPEGVQTAFLQGSSNPGTFSQNITVSAAGNYQVKFKAARHAAGGGVPIQLAIDNAAQGAPVTPTDTAFTQYSSATFALSSGTHLLQFSTTSPSGVSRSLIDDVKVQSTSSVILPAPIAPPTVTGLFATSATGRVSLAWSPVAGATGYRIKRGTASGGPYVTLPTTESGTSFADTSVSNGVAYYYRVYALNGAYEGGDSNEVSATPLAVATVTATAGVDRITLNWNAVAGATSYSVIRTATYGGTTGTSVPVAGNSATDAGLSSSTQFYYRVTATNASGTSTALVATATLPAAPYNVSARQISPSSVELNWSLGAGTAPVSYKVKRATTSNGPYTTLAPDITGTNFIDNGLTPATYYYRVYAVNASGNGSDSSEVPVTLVAPLPAPANLTAQPGDATVALRWDSVSGATKYTITKSTAANGPYGVVGESSVNYPYNAGTSYDVGNLVNGTTYYFRVMASNAAGSGADSNTASATPLARPAAPTNLMAVAGDRQVSLSWTAVPAATSYSISIFSAPANYEGGTSVSASFVHGGLTNGVTYYYRVSAVNASGFSLESNEVSATPLAPPPAAPTNLTAIAGDTQVVLNWSAVAGATSYKIKRSTTSGKPYTTLPNAASGNTYTDTGLTNGTTYYYVVYAVNANGPGSDSNEASATPLYTAGLVRQGGFETPNLPAASHQYTNLVGSEWTFDQGSGLASNGSAFNNANAPEGVQVAFVQATGSIKQTVTFGAGTYALRFQAAARNGLSQDYAIKIDGTTIDTLTQSNHPSSGYQQVTSSAFTLAAGAHEVQFAGLNNVDRTVFVDDVQTVTATPPPAPPSAPTNLQAIAGDRRVDLTWTAVAGATDYEVYAGTDPNALAPVGTTVAPNFAHDQLTNGTTYYYRVLSRKAGINSPQSNQVSATPIGKTLNLAATAGNTQVVLNWDAVSGATKYKIKISTTNGGPYTTLNDEVAGTSYTSGGLTNGTPYYYRVYAINVVGRGPDSDQASATPIAPVTPPPPSADRLVDLSIEAMDNSTQGEIGVNEYHPEFLQQVTYSIADRGKATFRLTVYNRGTQSDNIRLSGRGDTPGWKVRYFSDFGGATDISAQVKGGTYIIYGLASLNSRSFRVEVTPDASAEMNVGKSVPMVAYSEDNSAARDQVTAISVPTSAPSPIYRPDTAVRVASQTLYKGEGIYDFMASDEQTVNSTVASGVAAVYNLKIINKGNVADRFNFKLPLTKQGWSLTLYDALSGGTDITGSSQQTSGVTTEELAPQQFKEFRLEVKPNSGTTGSFPISVVTTSFTDSAVQDVGVLDTTVGNVSASASVDFTGSPRACAGGIDNPLHKLTLMLRATSNGSPLPNAPIALSFENNVGHNYGTRASPNTPRKAKIYDPNEPVVANRWKESVTLSTNANGDVQVIVLSSDVISQPRLVARWQNAIVGSVPCDFAAAISKRGEFDPAIGDFVGWENYDRGWTCDIGSFDTSGDLTTGKLYMKFQLPDGTFSPVAGHRIRISMATLRLQNGTDVSDRAEMSRYLTFVDANSVEQNTFVATTDNNGIAQFQIKAKSQFLDVKSVLFAGSSLSQWSK